MKKGWRKELHKRLKGFTWEMEGYAPAVSFASPGVMLTTYIAHNIYKLTPPPPSFGTKLRSNDYIVKAKEEKDLKYFSFFLHHNEDHINRVIHKQLAKDGDIRYDPERFIEIKQECLEMMLWKMIDYDPTRGAVFTTYIYEDIKDAIREYQMTQECWGFSTPSVYKKIRTAGYMHTNYQNAAEEFAKKYNCRRKNAEEYIQDAKFIHSRKSLYITSKDGEISEEAHADSTHLDNVELIRRRELRKSMQKAFDQLDDQEKYYLQKRNAVCMECGNLGKWKDRLTFDELGAPFNITTANGAEKAYNKAVEHLGRLMVEAQSIRMVTVKKIEPERRRKKVVYAIYEYQADNEGEWGEIHFDFKKWKADIKYLTDYDTSKTHVYARKAMQIVFDSYEEGIPDEKTVFFPIW